LANVWLLVKLKRQIKQSATCCNYLINKIKIPEYDKRKKEDIAEDFNLAELL
jgi:hypothetical protein